MTSIDRADMRGRRVEVPAKITRAASISPYVTFTALALGGEDVLVGVDAGSCQNANLAQVYPAIRRIPDIGSVFNVNKASLLQANPEVVLTVTWDRDPDKTQSMLGIPVLCVDMNQYKESIEFIAQVLGKEDRAKAFTAYYDDKKAAIVEMLSDVPASQKAKVYVASKKGLVSTFGKESTWHFDIQDAGGINVAADLVGGGAHQVDAEQVLTWNPDVIILDKSCPDKADSVPSDPRWQSVKAVKTKRVYRAPDGFLDTWGRPHLESVLARVWLADKLYPGRLGIKIEDEARDFYSRFYGVTLPDVNKILNPDALR